MCPSRNFTFAATDDVRIRFLSSRGGRSEVYLTPFLLSQGTLSPCMYASLLVRLSIRQRKTIVQRFSTMAPSLSNARVQKQEPLVSTYTAAVIRGAGNCRGLTQ